MNERPRPIAAPDTERWNALRNRARATAEPRQWYRITNAAGEDGQAAQIDLYDEIGYFGITAADFVNELRSITAPEISLHINSPGGDVYEGLACYNALLDHPATITVTVDGLAASAASFIAQAGDRIVMGRNSEQMIHDALGMTVGNAADHREMADLLDKASDNIASIYAARAGNGGVKTWRARMESESWYSAQEAVDIGLADEVLKTEKRSGDSGQVAAKWDLSIFAHTCRADAGPPDLTDAAPRKPKDPDPEPLLPEEGGPVGPAVPTPPENSVDPFVIPDDIPWPETKALHLAMLDAADQAGLDVDTTPMREALEGDWAYDPDALRGHLLDLADHVPPTEQPAPEPPSIRYVDLDVIADALKEAMSS